MNMILQPEWQYLGYLSCVTMFLSTSVTVAGLLCISGHLCCWWWTFLHYQLSSLSFSSQQRSSKSPSSNPDMHSYITFVMFENGSLRWISNFVWFSFILNRRRCPSLPLSFMKFTIAVSHFVFYMSMFPCCSIFPPEGSSSAVFPSASLRDPSSCTNDASVNESADLWQILRIFVIICEKY